MCFFYFFTMLIHFSIKNISYSIYFFSFSSKNNFCVFFQKREEINERNCYGIFYTFSLILKWCRKEKNSNQIKIFLISFWYNNTIYKKTKKIHHQKIVFIFFLFFLFLVKINPNPNQNFLFFIKKNNNGKRIKNQFFSMTL